MVKIWSKHQIEFFSRTNYESWKITRDVHNSMEKCRDCDCQCNDLVKVYVIIKRDDDTQNRRPQPRERVSTNRYQNKSHVQF